MKDNLTYHLIFNFFCVCLYIRLAKSELHGDIPLFGQPTSRNTILENDHRKITKKREWRRFQRF